MFMNEEIKAAYEEVPRFDESEFYNGEEYNKLMARMAELEKELFDNVGRLQWEMFQRHMSMLYEECEFECMHFFQQGWLSAKKDKQTGELAGGQ